MNILVTGGGGFLGRHIALRLHDAGHTVTILGRKRYEGLPETLNQIQADLRDAPAIENACAGMNAVFHAGAMTGIWGNSQDFQDINVGGTQNVLKACLQYGISRLVYTSSPSVVYDRADLQNADESLPYARRWLCDYPKTKAVAEKVVLDANGQEGLLTTALRPHLIWGPGDPHLVPRIVERARRGQLVRVGDGSNRVDIIYIDNAVEGHVRAFEALEDGSAVAGKVYFLSDGEPVVLWDWINELLQKLDIPPVTRSISYQNAKCLGHLLEGIYRAFGLTGEPRMTRFLASQLATSHYFDISAAQRDFNYRPIVSPQEGMDRLIRSLKTPPTG